MAKTEVKNLKLIIKAVGDKALKGITKELRSVSKNTKKIKSNLSGLRNVFLGVFAGIGIRGVARMADEMQLLEDRLTVFTGSTAEAEKTLFLLADAADLTNSSIDKLGEVYNRVALATQELGLSTEELVGFTTTLQNTFRLSGATAAEAAGASIQLSQGLASGQLRGQELRSVLEANVVIGGLLAKQFNTTRGQLIKFAEKGLLSASKVMEALSDNAEEINKQASKLGTTFGQTVTKAMNKASLAVRRVNKKFKLNEAFEKGVNGVSTALESLVESLGRSKVFKKTIKFLTDFTRLSVKAAEEYLGKKTPYQVLQQQLIENGKKIDLFKKKIKELSSESKKSDNSFLNSTLNSLRKLAGKGNGIDLLDSYTKRIKNLRIENKKLLKIQDSIGKGDKKTDTKKILSEAKKAVVVFSNGNFDVKTKGIALSIESINKEFSKTKDIVAYGKALNLIKTQKIEDSFKKGKIDAFQYKEELRSLRDELNSINGVSFNPLERGAERALKKIGSTADEIAGAIENSFSTLENQLVDFVKTGKFLFNDFAQAVLDDLTRIAIRQAIIKPIAGALFGGSQAAGSSIGSLSGSSGSAITSFSDSHQFSSGLSKFASGGVVSSPTLFPMNKGKSGLMGEAGPEAIVPLKRTQSGDLGVQAVPSQVVVNVTNNAGVDVDVQESFNGKIRMLDLTITKTVNNAMKNGRFDKALSSNFGVNRKGSK